MVMENLYIMAYNGYVKSVVNDLPVLPKAHSKICKRSRNT